VPLHVVVLPAATSPQFTSQARSKPRADVPPQQQASKRKSYRRKRHLGSRRPDPDVAACHRQHLDDCQVGRSVGPRSPSRRLDVALWAGPIAWARKLTVVRSKPRVRLAARLYWCLGPDPVSLIERGRL
jgi:hypothetical protein